MAFEIVAALDAHFAAIKYWSINVYKPHDTYMTSCTLTNGRGLKQLLAAREAVSRAHGACYSMCRGPRESIRSSGYELTYVERH